MAAFPPHLLCICLMSPSLLPVFFLSSPSPMSLHLTPPASHPLVSLVCVKVPSLPVPCVTLILSKRYPAIFMPAVSAFGSNFSASKTVTESMTWCNVYLSMCKITDLKYNRRSLSNQGNYLISLI